MNNEQSIRYKINSTIVITLAMVTVIFGTILMLYESSRHDVAIATISLSLDELSKTHSDVLGNEIFSNQILAIEETMKSIVAAEKNNKVLSIAAYNDLGEILASTDSQLAGDLPPDELDLLSTQSTTKQSSLASTPILSYKSPIVAYGETVGYWQILYSIDNLYEQTKNIILIFLASILTLSAILLWLLNSILIRFALNPIQMLRDIMQLIDDNEERSSLEGKEKRIDRMIASFDKLPYSMNLEENTRNEIKSLSYSFLQMLYALKHSYIGIRSDSLTGLANRVKLDDAIEQEIYKAQRYIYTFSVILIDLDFFKRINDTQGHLAGDEVLKTLANILKKEFRNSDIVGRWGGEEFLILLPKTDIQQAAAIAESLRKIVESSSFPSTDSLTSSFGVAQYQADEKASDLLQRADDALYQAKALGRNRVELSEEHQNQFSKLGTS